MRSLLLFLIGIVFGTTLGFLLSGGLGGAEHAHDHAGHSSTSHDQSGLAAWEGVAPKLALALTSDIDDALNLQIQTEGFTFTPELVNGPNEPGTGHAHIFINGKKVARAYSAWTHLNSVPNGATIRVTLNANDHSGWGLNGQPITAEIIAP